MNARITALFVVTLAILGAVVAVRGGTNTLETFDYADGTAIANQSGGTGWSGAWGAVSGNGTMVAENGSLTWPGIVSGGGKMHFTGVPLTGTTTVSYRNPAVPMSNGTFYIRFLSQNLNEGRRYFGLGLFNGGTERALLGQGSGYPYWTLNHVDGVTNALYTNILVSAVDSSDVALLVLKLVMTDGVERVTFWVNPDLSQPESAATAVGGDSFKTDADFGSITRLRIGSGGYSATAGGNPTDHYMDEISVSQVSPFAPPSLTGRASAGSIAMTWPQENLGWTLQTNGLGLADVNAWGDLPETSLVTATNLAAGAAVFYRLRSP